MATEIGKLAVNMDALLAGTLDDLADLPEFKAFPAGAHKVKFNWSQKEINKHPAIEVKLTAIETMELVDAVNDQPLEAGTETTVAYMLDNEIGQGKFKELMKLIAAKFGAKPNGELLKDMQDLEIVAVTAKRENKDKTQTYTDLENIAFL